MSNPTNRESSPPVHAPLLGLSVYAVRFISDKVEMAAAWGCEHRHSPGQPERRVRRSQ